MPGDHNAPRWGGIAACLTQKPVLVSRAQHGNGGRGGIQKGAGDVTLVAWRRQYPDADIVRWAAAVMSELERAAGARGAEVWCRVRLLRASWPEPEGQCNEHAQRDNDGAEDGPVHGAPLTPG